MRIDLDYSNDLKIDNTGALALNISSENPQDLHYEDDGIFIDAPDGESQGTGEGYSGHYDAEGIRLGSNCPFGQLGNVDEDHMVTCTNIIHRVFDSKDDKGIELINFRPEIDCTLVGDMFRVSKGDGTYDYYLIIDTRKVELGVCGNFITDSVYLGSW